MDESMDAASLILARIFYGHMMKTKNIFLRMNLLLFVMAVASCVKLSDSMQPAFTLTPTLRATNALPTLTSVATDTPTTLPTLTMISSLPEDEARTRILELLSNNGGCQLPCLWGITPGKSLYQEARTILLPLNNISNSTHLYASSPDDIAPAYTEGDLMLRTFIAYLYADDGIVKSIAFQSRELKKITTPDNGNELDPVFDSSVFGERMDFYMLHGILTAQGFPESVMLGTVANIPSREPAGGFHILLLYPEQGILIDYETEMHKTGSYISGCPANAHVEMDLYPPGNTDAFFASLEKTDAWAVKKKWYKPLEEATSMSMAEFYETFREPNTRCIETLASLWPKPDP